MAPGSMKRPDSADYDTGHPFSDITADMIPRPSSAQRRPTTTPPPSRALLELQKQGLELAASRSQSSLYLDVPHNKSGRSTPSDRDKPLPLEPFEKRRSSSVYSTDTTITNIIRMYNGYQELIDGPAVPTIHAPQAYRDTIAPLLIQRLSISKTPSPQPPTTPVSQYSASNLSVQHTPLPMSNAPLGNKTAPTFVEFSRALQERRNELVSPLSASSAEQHRQTAYDNLSPPSPQVSSVELSFSVSQTPPVPDAMSGSISDVDESDLLPPPLGLTDSGPPSPVSDDWEMQSDIQSASPGDAAEDRSHDPAGAWLDEDFVRSPVSGSNKPWERTSFRLGRSPTEKEKERIMSYATTKWPAMSGDTPDRKKSQRSSARSSLQQGVSSLLRSISLSKREMDKDGHQEVEVPREKHLAKPATPYQVYGAEIWSKKTKKKQQQQQQQDMQRSHKRGKSSVDLVHAYQNGQTQFVGVIEGAKRKLTRRTSQKRRRKLKQSIVFVGPTQTTSTMHSMDPFTGDDEASWI
ncbi:hypothetical protein LTR99_000140 [Exophiala xenobiotica]|uniref:Uncharacterized protein n=1 Tax=Vermiconidia calcicola TaxID=1690605 RepID=A0AAV9PVQ2_9PEZI|nr:hypothetical protein LTR72_000728 [Exophiala xenobiotica]KAK5530052.1 hypothetical protein LTR25_009296 [Vermiconidia calcicola]KAK5547372.1 hypothetical protein LTR23_002592 [Chaetothyriales sp. CCFEE 6169]KAK5265415.1 hypothetical protein LTR96_009319 [Exophiala xenobiotica]KAK5288450.1 hypothetical protein LTR14_008310 [Exophiala xenobiotica]